jgi:response regulator RpfG family c-di-GMP phosphodiesterase
VLFVDDDDNILASAHRNFRKRYELDTASGGEQALRAMEEHGPYAVVVADMAMPGMNGIEFLKRAQILAPATIRIMFTGHPGPITLLAAINSGQVFRFIPKPCQTEDLAKTVDAGIEQYRLVTAERDLLETTLTGSIEAMTGMLEALDPATFSCARILAERAVQVARAMGARDAWSINLAARFSPLWILPLEAGARVKTIDENLADPATARALSQAVEKAADLIQPIPRLEDVAQLIRYLAKGFDGSGCPGGDLTGESLPLGSRILGTLLDFNILETRVKSREVALEYLRLKGQRYDPKVMAALAEVFKLPLLNH